MSPTPVPPPPPSPPPQPDRFEGPVDIGPAAPPGLVARFVRYPGCQQLQLWLPQPDHNGARRVQVRRADGLVVDDAALHERLSGPVQLLFDTLAWPPGAYQLTVDAAPGQPAVALALHKWAADPPAAPPPADARVDAGGRGAHAGFGGSEPAPVYRDGLGRVLPDEAQRLRDTAWAQLQRRFSRQVRVHNQGRAGTVTYEERLPQLRRLHFAHEIAGGPWHWAVTVPTPARWQAETGLPLAERDELLRFVAESLQRSQGPHWAWTLTDDTIAFHDPPPPHR